MSVTKDKLFVYGILKGGESSAKETSIKGTLYDLGPFPGLRLEGEGEVKGELIEVDDLDIENFDIIEGHPFLYKRERVVTNSGEKCWVYVYQRNVAYLPIIEDGNWNN